jgi:hypothetical protein
MHSHHDRLPTDDDAADDARPPLRVFVAGLLTSRVEQPMASELPSHLARRS